jgi:hypothetical protein
MPEVRNAALRIGSGPAAASGLGTARDQAACDGVPAASAHLPVLQCHDLRGTAAGSTDGPIRPAARGVLRAVDGVLSAKQAADRTVPRGSARAALLPVPDRQDAEPGLPGPGRPLPGTQRRPDRSAAGLHGRVADQRGNGAGVALDGRGSHVRCLCDLPQPSGDGYRPAPGRWVHRHHQLRPCQDVLAGRSAPMVLGSPETRYPGVDRPSRQASEALGA